jgi:hypothetical protein
MQMSAVVSFRRAVIGAALFAVIAIDWVPPALAEAPTGGFLAVSNTRRDFGDSMNTIAFFDVDDLSTPLFSVYIGDEFGTTNNWEEPTAIAADPATGDIYVVAFDSNTGGIGNNDDWGDTIGDLDLYKIDFGAVYDHWSTNFQGQNVQTLPNPSMFGWGPTPTGANNSTNLDYVTYRAHDDEFVLGHSNTYTLPSAIEKIGQVNRGDGGSFYDFDLTFIEEGKLFLLDDSIAAQSLDDPLNDHVYRWIDQVAPTNGAAASMSVNPDALGAPFLEGGYNGSMGVTNSKGRPTQSWESTVLRAAGGGTEFLMQLDGAGHSEPRSTAYYDSGTGLRGFWISEGDMPPPPLGGQAPTIIGDTIAFLEVDANGEVVGYRPIATGGGSPFTYTVSDDPATSEFTFDGKVSRIFLDEDTGDLIIVESGFEDGPVSTDPLTREGHGINPTDEEPAVLRVNVTYDNGLGEIEITGWEPKAYLHPTKPGTFTGTTHSIYAEWDSENDLMYFFAPYDESETIGLSELDIHVLDYSLGNAANNTTTYTNVDDDYSLFGGAAEDNTAFFSLAAPGLLGDFNEDGKVDAADYVVWRKNGANPLPNDSGLTTSQARFDLWRANFGNMQMPGGGSGGAVPEPASAALLLLGLAVVGWRRRAA